LLIRAQTTDVALVWIERLGDVAEDSKGVQEPENDLEAHDTVTALQPGDGLTRHARTIAKLSLGQSTKLAPGLNVCAEVSQRPPNWKGRHNRC
jgi:hypothetical protein